MKPSLLFLIIVGLLAAMSCRVGLADGHQNDTPMIVSGRKLVLPEKLQTTLAMRLPDYRLPTKEDYRVQHDPADSARAAVRGRETDIYPLWYEVGDSVLPFICWGDFNGDSLTDVAMMLVPKENKSVEPGSKPLGPTLAVFHQTNTSYDVLMPWENFPGNYVNYDLHTQPPGAIESYDGKPELSVKTRFESIGWDNWESSSCVLYWDGEKYVQVWTGD